MKIKKTFILLILTVLPLVLCACRSFHDFHKEEKSIEKPEPLVIEVETESIPKENIETEEETSPMVEEIFDEGWVNVPCVNVRKEPDINSEILCTYGYNTYLLKTAAVNEEWLKIMYNDEFAYIKKEYVSNEENAPLSPYYSLINNLSEDEKYHIYQIAYLESGNQTMEGQRAVIEVILNRVLSEKYPNDVIGVLSQSGQFVTWDFRYAHEHNAQQVEALELVRTQPSVLSKEYLMFSIGKFSWGRNYVQIGDHWFGTF